MKSLTVVVGEVREVKEVREGSGVLVVAKTIIFLALVWACTLGLIQYKWSKDPASIEPIEWWMPYPGLALLFIGVMLLVVASREEISGWFRGVGSSVKTLFSLKPAGFRRRRA